MTSIREFLSIAFREKRLLLWAIAIPPVLALLLALITRPVYEATASVLVKTGREYEGRSDLEQGGSGSPTTTKQEAINSEIEIMTNRAAIVEVIRRVGFATIYPDEADREFSGKVMDTAVNSFLTSLTVKPVKLTNVIAISYDHHNPQVAVNVVNTLLDVYKGRHAAAFSESHSEALKNQIDRDNTELEALVSQYEKIKLANHVSNLDQQQQALISLQSEAAKDRDTAIARRDELRKRLAYLTQQQHKIPASQTEVDTERDEAMINAQSSLVALKQSEADLLTRYGPDHPQVVDVRQQIAALEQEIREQPKAANTRTLVNPLAQQIDTEIVMDQAELVPLSDKIASLDANYRDAGDQLQKLERANVDLVSLDSRIKAHLENLTLLRDKYEQAKVLDELDSQKIVSVSVIQPAMAATRPVAPHKLIYIGVGLLLGLLVAGTVLVIRIMTRNTLISAEGAERLLELPVLTSVPRLNAPAGGARLVGSR